ncbi:hypothetical protein B0H11DRAFT_1939323 [Mycena galericulata]|nr:hypothetical protein B0H11DRAFT_1939323 [Mycena galericulata]
MPVISLECVQRGASEGGRLSESSEALSESQPKVYLGSTNESPHGSRMTHRPRFSPRDAERQRQPDALNDNSAFSVGLSPRTVSMSRSEACSTMAARSSQIALRDSYQILSPSKMTRSLLLFKVLMTRAAGIEFVADAKMVGYSWRLRTWRPEGDSQHGNDNRRDDERRGDARPARSACVALVPARQLLGPDSAQFEQSVSHSCHVLDVDRRAVHWRTSKDIVSCPARGRCFETLATAQAADGDGDSTAARAGISGYCALASGSSGLRCPRSMSGATAQRITDAGNRSVRCSDLYGLFALQWFHWGHTLH